MSAQTIEESLRWAITSLEYLVSENLSPRDPAVVEGVLAGVAMAKEALERGATTERRLYDANDSLALMDGHIERERREGARKAGVIMEIILGILETEFGPTTARRIEKQFVSELTAEMRKEAQQ